MLRDTEWVLVVGGLAAFLNAVTVGANTTAVCWGPTLGAKVVNYRTAAVLGIVCQSVGVLAFGPRQHPVFGGFLESVRGINAQPNLALYAQMWAVLTPPIWALLAIRWHILLPAYLGTVASTVGAALAFPGAAHIEVGQSTAAPPFVTGLGPIFMTWICAPGFGSVMVVLCLLYARSTIMRGEDTFHRALWVAPSTGCWTGIVTACFAIFVIGPPLGYLDIDRYNLTPQEVAVVVAASGSVGCLITCCWIPGFTRRMSNKAPAVKALKRMSLLGLDEATVQQLSEKNSTGDVQGWIRGCHAWLFEGDLFADVAADPALLRIHATAEEFDPATEEVFVPFQVIMCMCLSVAHGANNARSSLGVFKVMQTLHASGSVPLMVELGYPWRLAAAFGMMLGSLFLGFRLTPVSGVLLAKMSPFRSCIVVLNAAFAIAMLGGLRLKGGITTYAIVSAVCTTGFIEGLSHVNWKKVSTLLIWWCLGFLVVLFATYLLVAQGIYAPSFTASRKPHSDDSLLKRMSHF